MQRCLLMVVLFGSGSMGYNVRIMVYGVRFMAGRVYCSAFGFPAAWLGGFMVNVVCCMVNVVCCMLYVAWCMVMGD